MQDDFWKELFGKWREANHSEEWQKEALEWFYDDPTPPGTTNPLNAEQSLSTILRVYCDEPIIQDLQQDRKREECPNERLIEGYQHAAQIVEKTWRSLRKKSKARPKNKLSTS